MGYKKVLNFRKGRGGRVLILIGYGTGFKCNLLPHEKLIYLVTDV